jgi:hypothetical protein
VDAACACDYAFMTTMNRIRRTLSGLVAETRPEFKRIDASRARYDDGAWLKTS